MSQTIANEQERYNVLAFVKGTKVKSNKTIILMGHLDTVGIDDFNQQKTFACDPEKLMEELRKEDHLPLISEHLNSDGWLFARGILDMKSGVASHLSLLKYYSENPDKLDGNLVFIAKYDEEDGSHGILSALTDLKEWKQEHNFDCVAAINAHFFSPRYERDRNRYIYKGTTGKLNYYHPFLLQELKPMSDLALTDSIRILSLQN